MAEGSSSSPIDKRFIDETVKAHNLYRKRHQVPPLSHSKELSAHAQKWADHLAATGAFQHSSATMDGERVGENIAMKWSSAPDAYTGQEVTDQWYSEVKMYVFGAEPSSRGSGHFTQVVWKGSREVGVGKAVSKDGKVFVVANYRPAGNVVGTFAKNVLPPADGKILLPEQPASKPFTTTSNFSHKGGATVGDVRGPLSRHFQDMESKFPKACVSAGGGARNESSSVRTYTVTEVVGTQRVTKTITEETIIKNGKKTVNRTEKVVTGGTTTTPSTSMPTADLAAMTLTDHKTSKDSKKKSMPFKKRSSSSSSDSSPERAKKTPASSRGSSSSGPQKMSDFHKDCLKAHNTKRALHGSPSLELASDLTKHAQKWAEHLAANEVFEHSNCLVNSNRVGENIACSWSSSGADFTGEQVVDQWYSEIEKHNFQSDSTICSGHFTQVVWKGSKELGVGKAISDNGKCIVVCNYRPAGNMQGHYKSNVLPPK